MSEEEKNKDPKDSTKISLPSNWREILAELVIKNIESNPVFREIIVNVNQMLSKLPEAISKYRDELIVLNIIFTLPEDIQSILPYILEELDELSDHEEIAGKSFFEILSNATDDNGQIKPGIFAEAIKRARKKAKQDEENITELPRIQYKKTTEIKTITDKLTNVFYSLTAPESSVPDVNGQRKMTSLRYENQKAKKEVTLFYDYVYNEDILKKYGLAKKFDDYDFFVMTIIDNLYSAGNNIVSLTKIYNEMGGEGSPTSKQLEPIYYTLLKGLSTTITIDDAEAQKAWNNDKTGTYHEIISPVIPVQIVNERFIANGKIANGYVKINEFSPFMRVAKPLGHLTAWEKEILHLYKGRKTSRYYSVLRFLMLQIGWMRNGDRSNKILYSSLYQYTGDTSPRAQQLTRDMMYRLLDEVFKPAGYITAYKEKADPTPGVVLTLSRKRLKNGGKR